MTHDCPEYINEHEGYGQAIENGIYRDKDGKVWAGNGEYGTRVNFCPWCGIDLRQVDEASKG